MTTHDNTENSLIIDTSDENLERDKEKKGLYSAGQWCWVKDDSDSEEWFGCIVRIGTNYIKLQSPRNERGCHSMRVHINDAYKELRIEEFPRQVILQKIEHFQNNVRTAMTAVQAITARLGVNKQHLLEQNNDSSGTGLATLSNQDNVNDYKKALISAKEKELPELFDEIKDANQNLTTWMSAEALPYEATLEKYESIIDEVDGRILNVSLYAGLTENVDQCCDGEPAAMTDKLHVMQRRLYMDEECLLDYKSGGMEFDNIEEFDKWVVKPVNRDRLMPFPRTVIAMQVRRREKHRENTGNILNAFINIELGELDKLTFLFIRNGEQVYRINCNLDFEEMIFPDKAVYDPTIPMMVKFRFNKLESMITKHDYDERLKEYNACKDNYEKWEKENPGGDQFDNPYRNNDHFSSSDWEPFNDSSVYYDDMLKSVTKDIQQYNRVSLIIQGIFDRSEILHPHPPIRSWTPEGFASAIELVYDSSNTLHYGDTPDFKGYQKRCNALTNNDSVMYGQELFWMEKEAQKLNDRIDRSWTRNRTRDYTTYRPHGNPGPGEVAKLESFKKRSQKCVFAWDRKRQTENYALGHEYGDPIRTTLTVPLDELFNVSAYNIGDYKQFFQDPRTREKYLEWAPMLLSAEDYHQNINTK